ncbi:hypothetical protein LCGC14_2228360 [marine sediment metagenome]|uniref:Uncharacterized protein n=1 Tax=marine sediment metagenome TaxID=412755 RepID=A0A0F9FLH2_9ZZZZ
MARANRYPGSCVYCSGPVRAFAGVLLRRAGAWTVAHTACEEGDGVTVIQIGDHTYTRNARGRCEDAPCCGCCTI